MSKKYDKNSLGVIADNMAICDQVFNLINNPWLRDNEIVKLYEVIIDPLYAITNSYVVSLGVDFERRGDNLSNDINIKRGELRELNMELNTLQVNINHKGGFITPQDIELLKRGYEVIKIIFENYRGK